MQQPKRFEVNNTQVCRLKKSLYGLKQASRTWYENLNEYLISIGFIRSNEDRCLYSKWDSGKLMLNGIYVDDLAIGSDDMDQLVKFKENMKLKYSMKDIGKLEYCLGMHVNYHCWKLSIDQHLYFTSLLKRFNILDCKRVSTPVVYGERLTKEMSPQSEE